MMILIDTEHMQTLKIIQQIQAAGGVDPRSTHTLTVKSLSIDPDAIIFCCGCVYRKKKGVMPSISYAPSQIWSKRLPRRPRRHLQKKSGGFSKTKQKRQLGGHFTLMALEDLHDFPTLQVPQVDLAIFATRNDPFAARDAEAGGDAVFYVLMADVRLEAA
jgi:hypothetical protein